MQRPDRSLRTFWTQHDAPEVDHELEYHKCLSASGLQSVHCKHSPGSSDKKFLETREKQDIFPDEKALLVTSQLVNFTNDSSFTECTING